MVSGRAAVVVGEPGGYAEISPVDEFAEVIAAAALGAAPSAPRTEVISAGQDSLRLDGLVGITVDTLNAFRAEHGVEPIAKPPTVSTDSWNRFFLPLAEQWLSPVQQQAVKLLAMFQSYTSMNEPFQPTRPVADPGGVMAASVRHWAESKPRQALGLNARLERLGSAGAHRVLKTHGAVPPPAHGNPRKGANQLTRARLSLTPRPADPGARLTPAALAR